MVAVQGVAFDFNLHAARLSFGRLHYQNQDASPYSRLADGDQHKIVSIYILRYSWLHPSTADRFSCASLGGNLSYHVQGIEAVSVGHTSVQT